MRTLRRDFPLTLHDRWVLLRPRIKNFRHGTGLIYATICGDRFLFTIMVEWVFRSRLMVRDAHPTIAYIFHVKLSSLLYSGWFVFLHGGYGPACADFGDRSRAGFITGGIPGLPASLAAVPGGCDGYAARSSAFYLDSTFHRWVKRGIYDPQWGCGVAERLDFSDLAESVGE